MTTYEHFKQLHNQPEPLLLGNSWNAHSAQLFEKMGFKAVATSSAAVANAMGYEDGEKIPFSQLLLIAETIGSKVKLPLTVDLETGYGKDETEIVDNIEKLSAAGVVGINIEDSVRGSSREIVPVADFSRKLEKIRSGLTQRNINLFINARTDGFLLGLPDPVAETKVRMEAYKQAGADGIFAPCIVKEEDIRQVAEATTLPLNVMAMPGLPAFDKLATLGVKRISMGNGLYSYMHKQLEKTITAITDKGSFEVLFS